MPLDDDDQMAISRRLFYRNAEVTNALIVKLMKAYNVSSVELTEEEIEQTNRQCKVWFHEERDVLGQTNSVQVRLRTRRQVHPMGEEH